MVWDVWRVAANRATAAAATANAMAAAPRSTAASASARLVVLLEQVCLFSQKTVRTVTAVDSDSFPDCWGWVMP